VAWRVAVSEKSVGSGLGGGDIALVGGGFSLGLGLDMDAFSLSLFYNTRTAKRPRVLYK